MQRESNWSDLGRQIRRHRQTERQKECGAGGRDHEGAATPQAHPDIRRLRVKQRHVCGAGAVSSLLSSETSNQQTKYR